MEQGCKIRHWHVFCFQHLFGSPLLSLPEKWLEVFHACVVALFQLVLVSLLVLLDKLTVPFQGISRFLQKVLVEYDGLLETYIWNILQYLETESQLVFMFAWHFALKELLQEHPGNLNGTLQKARLVIYINISLGGHWSPD